MNNPRDYSKLSKETNNERTQWAVNRDVFRRKGRRHVFTQMVSGMGYHVAAASSGVPFQDWVMSFDGLDALKPFDIHFTLCLVHFIVFIFFRNEDPGVSACCCVVRNAGE